MNKTNAFPAGDINSRDANYVSGGGPISITKKPDHTRSTVRDHLASTIASHPTKLNFLGNSMVTKILTCSKSNGGLRAYGIEYTPGAALLPGAGLFKGKARTALAKKQFTAKYEVIISTGAYQTPQLLMVGILREYSWFLRSILLTCSFLGSATRNNSRPTVSNLSLTFRALERTFRIVLKSLSTGS